MTVAVAAALAERLAMVAGHHHQGVLEVSALLQHVQDLPHHAVGLQHSAVVKVERALTSMGLPNQRSRS